MINIMIVGTKGRKKERKVETSVWTNVENRLRGKYSFLFSLVLTAIIHLVVIDASQLLFLATENQFVWSAAFEKYSLSQLLSTNVTIGNTAYFLGHVHTLPECKNQNCTSMRLMDNLFYVNFNYTTHFVYNLWWFKDSTKWHINKIMAIDLL